MISLMASTTSAPSLFNDALTSRLRAAALHLALSVAVAVMAGALVFALWYPSPFDEISGGRELFLLVMAIDVVVGPLITLAVFNSRKPRRELARDIAVVVLLQAGALAYGLYTVALARPVVVSLEADRLRVVRAIDLSGVDLSRAPNGLQRLSWLGPRFVVTRRPSPSEQLDTIDRALSGQDIGARPEFWQALAVVPAEYANAAVPLKRLLERQPTNAAALRSAARSTGRQIELLGYLPILGRRTDWSALIDLKDGSVAGYVPIDGF
jgi:hypothetical protein